MLTFPKFEPAFPRQSWTLKHVLEHQARVVGNRPFLRWGEEEREYSFDETNRISNRLARGFKDLGIKRGGAVVLFMPNCLDYIFSWFALSKLAAIEVPINIAYKGKFLEHQVNISGAATVVVDITLIDAILESIERMPAVKKIVLRSADNVVPDAIKKKCKCEIVPFSSLMAEDDANLDVVVRPQDIGAIMFTSGTTGLSKGVMMPHAQMYLFSEIDVQGTQLTGDDVYLTALPLFHANAQVLAVYPSLIAGARAVVFERFSASKWVDRLHSSGATVTNSLGVMLHFVYAQPGTPRDRNHRLKRIFAGPTPYKLVDDFEKRFGVKEFTDAFGQTEICCPVMTPLSLKLERPPGAAGLLLDQWFEARIVDPDTDEELPVGEVGEMLIRHKEPWTINAGYVGMPEKASEAWRNLWFHTGDAVRRDAEGWYYFVDRIKDALRRRGENISSFEVESALAEHEAVADVAVVAVPANDGGGEDEVKACVVLSPGFRAEPMSLINWCMERLPAFAVPRFIEFLPELPRTPSEKIKKNELRAAGVTRNTWDRNTKSPESRTG